MLAMATSITSIAQHQATVDNNRGEINPIVKRYGTNLPASTSYDMLKVHHISKGKTCVALKDEHIPYLCQSLYRNLLVPYLPDFL